MITYIWKIEDLSTLPQDGEHADVVVKALWSLTGSDGEYLGYARGMSDFALDETKNFTPFNDLTESQVVSWIRETITPDRFLMIEAEISGQIKMQKTQPVKPQPQPLPWQ